MNQLGRYLEESGRTADEVAVDLSALLGKKIGPGGVRLHASRAKTPKTWAEALGLPPDDEPESSPGPSGDLYDLDATPPGDQHRVDDAPPTPPAGAKVTIPPGGPLLPTHVAARERLKMAYAAIGAGATLVTSNKGYEAVADSYAPSLADAWIKAAETSPTVAKIVTFMESGGAVGELIVSHVILVLGFAYVSGRGPDLDFLYGKFAGYRAGARAAEVQREADAHLNGTAGAAATGGVASASG